MHGECMNHDLDGAKIDPHYSMDGCDHDDKDAS